MLKEGTKNRVVWLNPRCWDEVRSSVIMNYVKYFLQSVPNLHVRESTDLPPQCIGFDANNFAFVDDFGTWKSTQPGHKKQLHQFIHDIGAQVVFKQQHRVGSGYTVPTISGGFPAFIYHPEFLLQLPDDLATRARKYDVHARMRIDQYQSPRKNLDWMQHRGTLVKQAMSMENEGYRTCTGLIAPEQYFQELLDTKIGFNWRGFEKLNYRVAEFLVTGAVMITEPYGKEWPLREDIVLEHEVNCIFCESPQAFAAEAKRLLKHSSELARIRANALESAGKKLRLEAMGAWYLEQMEHHLTPVACS